MRVENKRILTELTGTWKHMFAKMFKDMKPGMVVVVSIALVHCMVAH
jgi:hypothetical protein